MRQTLWAALFGLTAIAGSLSAQTLPPSAAPGFERALESFRGQRYAGAYARFAQLADAGHVPSAQIALLMVQHGRGLFGSDWSATPDQQRRWNALVINAARGRLDYPDNLSGD
ncbi:MAG: hypothetical protein KIT35_02445 [Piscinibacter sp.]|uniref:hypothetical protein n=1 Tax=Piscinibacter sp. TaxID=1903157 RepID=UPI002586F725|nr:hypothetical protein [Piscinibacter sp.]MCW5662670.1 hypothetical protein [Piscinibacter sp.]